MTELSFPVGRVTISAPTSFEERFEFAAWWQTVECAPQSATLYAILAGAATPYDYKRSELRKGGPVDFRSALHVPAYYIGYSFDGIVKDADFTSHFGGVPYGGSNAERYVGRPARHSARPYAFFFREQFDAMELEFERGGIAYAFDGSKFDLVRSRYIPEYPDNDCGMQLCIRICRNCLVAAAPEDHPALCCECFTKLGGDALAHREAHRYGEAY